MKTRFIFFFLFATTTILAQTKLCEESAVGYSVCFNLEKDSIFSFEFNHCTGSTLGIGKYTKNKKTLTFVFDAVDVPKPPINKYYDTELTNKVKITTYHEKSKFPIEFVSIFYLDKENWTDEEGNYFVDYSGGSITITDYNDIVINPDKDSSNTYEIYLATDIINTYVDGGTIVKMKKVGEKYKLKEKVRFNKKKRGEQEYYLKWTTKYYVER